MGEDIPLPKGLRPEDFTKPSVDLVDSAQEEIINFFRADAAAAMSDDEVVEKLAAARKQYGHNDNLMKQAGLIYTDRIGQLREQRREKGE